MKKIIVFVTVAMIGLIIYSLFEAENINSLKGNFAEVGFIRNKNNTGPIHRVYAFAVDDTLWSEMEKHIDLLPHTKYGTTEAFYFLKSDLAKSDLKLDMNGLNSEVKSKCLVHAVKDGQLRITFKKNPF